MRLSPPGNPIGEGALQPCNRSSGGLPVQIRASRNAQGVTVNILAYTVSGFDRFWNRNVPPWIEDTPENSPLVYRTRSTPTYTGTSTGWFSLNRFPDSSNTPNSGSPCFPDDNLIAGISEVKVVLMPGTGYTINPDMREVIVNITDENEESCDNEAEIARRAMSDTAPLMYKVTGNGSLGSYSGTCICATEAQVDEFRLKPHMMCDDSPWPGDE